MTKLYGITVSLDIKVEADSRDEAKREAVALAEQVERGLPVGASIRAINGDSLKLL
jgi:hypothetical protein